MKILGRNTNSNDIATVTTYAINSVTPTTVSIAQDRIFIEICLGVGITDVDAYLRLYPAALDSIQQGTILTRRTASNDALFSPIWRMAADNIYTGEISMISASGTFNIHVTEY